MKRFLSPGVIAAVLLISFSTPYLRADDALARVRRDGVLRWGADPNGGAPYVFIHPRKTDEIIGFEKQIMERIAERMGVRLEMVVGEWDALPATLERGDIDIFLNGFEILPEREADYLFTLPYFVYRQQLTVREEDRARYLSLHDLKGKPIGVLDASASVGVLEKAGWDEDLIKPYKDSLAPYEDLKFGRVEAVLTDNIIAFYYSARDPDLVNIPHTFAPGRYGGIVRKSDRPLLMELNKHLAAMMQSGELGQIYQEWGMWSPAQEELGVVRGEVVPMSELAQYDPSQREGIGWNVVVQLLKASRYTVLLTVIAMPLALAFGLLLALMSMSRNPLWCWPARFYIQVIRGTPLLVQVFLIYFTLPQLGKLLGLGDLLTFNNFWVGVICLAANYAAYEAEIHRAGIEAVPKGQRLAALALGMSERQTFFSIILPQSFRIILPPVLNDFIAMLKDSCVVYVIGVQELLTVALSIGKSRVAIAEMLVIAAIIYLLLSLAADYLGRLLEARLRKRGFNVVHSKAGAH